MNVIFVTQGEYASFYLDILPLIAEKQALDRVGFYVTDRSNYEHYLRKAENLNSAVMFLKGWEIAATASENLDKAFLEKIEEEFGDPFLWNTLVMDRRVYNGILTKYKQDYKPRFSHTQMLSLLQRGFKSVLEFIENIQPDVIIGGFTPVTFVEYIFYLCARAKGIRYINLNPTKILNYVTFSEEVYREFPRVAEDYQKYLESDHRDVFWEKAEEYLEMNSWNGYEGVVAFPSSFPWKKWCLSVSRWPLLAIHYYLRRDYRDNQTKGRHRGAFFRDIYNPVKDKVVQKIIPYCSLEQCKQFEYGFYPLHVEPEISLSLFGREHLNQIELIRNIAKSMPVTWKLVVKDHPAGVGRRNIRYYKKLLEIPNVVMVNHHVNSKDIIESAKIVFTVSGFAGFEAILKKKAVITFGKTFYGVLPKCMVQNVRCLEELPFSIKKILGHYQYSEKEIICLVAAIMKNSIPLNLYTQVLKKKERIQIGSKKTEEQKQEFADYLLKFI